MTEIRLSDVDEMLANAGALFSEHWEEVALNKQVMVLKPDEQKYRAMEANGMLLILGAFCDGRVVGYSVNFVTNHPHYADLIVCNNDLLFVTEDKRCGRLGLQLIRATEKEAKQRGVQLMLWHAKPGTALEQMMPRLGYGVQDTIFSIQI
jgi:predicted GNAT superfamily acetyltransferase